jgi:hypothetical protein
MTEPVVAATAPPEPPAANVALRFWGILSAPRETFAGVVKQPRWLGMVLIVVAVGVLAGTLIMATDVGRTAALDAARTQMDSLGIKMPPEAEKQMEKAILEAPLWRSLIQTAIAQLLFGFLVPLLISGVLFVAFNALLGGESNFKQLLATVVHASPVQVIGVLFSTPVMYYKESLSSVTNLGVLLPMLDEGSFLAKFLGSIDLIRVWWIVVLSIGLGVLYRRKSRSIAITLFVIYGLIAAAWAAVLVSRAGA